MVLDQNGYMQLLGYVYFFLNITLFLVYIYIITFLLYKKNLI